MDGPGRDGTGRRHWLLQTTFTADLVSCVPEVPRREAQRPCVRPNPIQIQSSHRKSQPAAGCDRRSVRARTVAHVPVARRRPPLRPTWNASSFPPLVGARTGRHTQHTAVGRCGGHSGTLSAAVGKLYETRMACAVWQVQQRTLSPDDRFVVIASDGLYDVLAVLPSPPSQSAPHRTTTLCCARGRESASVCMAMRCSTVVRAQCQGTVEAATVRCPRYNTVRHTD